jgi:cell division transport system permease protein
MQMVGATRGFIAKPINQRAVINGLIASGIAIVAIWSSVMLIEGILPDFKLLHDNIGLVLLFFVIVVLGITISLASTHRAVIKYLKMKLDDLY